MKLGVVTRSQDGHGHYRMHLLKRRVVPSCGPTVGLSNATDGISCEGLSVAGGVLEDVLEGIPVRPKMSGAGWELPVGSVDMVVKREVDGLHISK
jgi:hypothetical protein